MLLYSYCLVLFWIWGQISKYKPPGAYIWRVDLTEGFFRYEFRGPVYRLSRDIRYLVQFIYDVLYLEGPIHGGAYFRNFTVFNLCNQLRILQTFTEKDTKNLNNSSRIKSVYLEDKAQLAYPITVQMRIRKYYQLVITLRAEVRGTQRLFPPKYIEKKFFRLSRVISDL